MNLVIIVNLIIITELLFNIDRDFFGVHDSFEKIT